MGISTDVFLTYLLKNLDSLYIERYHREIVIINDFINTQNTYARMNEICSQKSSVINIDFEKIKFGLLLRTFDEDTFSGTIDVMLDSYSGGDPGGYMPFDQKYIPDYYEYARTGLPYYKRLLTLIESNLNKSGQRSLKLSKALSNIDSKREYANSSFKKWREIGKCSLKILNEERKIISYVFEKEKQYIRNVHQDIHQLRTNNSPESTQAILNKYKGVDSFLLNELVPLNVQSLDIISKDGYLTTQFNFYSRVAHYLNTYRGAVRIKVLLPAEIKKSKYYSYRDLNGNTSTVRPYFIPYQNSLSDFLRFFCDSYFSTGASSFTLWLSYSSYGSKVADFFRSETTSLSFGQLSIFDYLSSFRDVADYFKILPVEREILGHLKKREPIMVTVHDDIFLKKAKNGIYDHNLGFFDLALTYFSQDVMGYDYWAEKTLATQDVQRSTSEESSIRRAMPLRRGLHAEAEIMFNTLRDSTTSDMLFDLDKIMIKKEYIELKQKIFSNQKLLEQFFQEVRREDFSNVRIDIYTDESMTGPLFSPYALDRYRSHTHEFQQKTGNCFNPDSNCF
jgi:hypothetical protein